MQWTEENRVKLYFIIEREWSRLDLPVWEEWLAGLGIKWTELDDDVNDAPSGTVAIHEGPGFEDESRKQCWVVPDEVALKLIALDPSPRRVPR